jgi:methionyl-tRNA formyltransferase
LLKIVTPKAAEMLVKGLRNRLFIPPLVDLGQNKRAQTLTHAPKITPEDRHIDWMTWGESPEIMMRRHLALQKLWTKTWTLGGQSKRLIFEDVELTPYEEIESKNSEHATSEEPHNGRYFALLESSEGAKLAIPWTADGDAVVFTVSSTIFGGIGPGVRVKRIKVEGKTSKGARKALLPWSKPMVV